MPQILSLQRYKGIVRQIRNNGFGIGEVVGTGCVVGGDMVWVGCGEDLGHVAGGGSQGCVVEVEPNQANSLA